MHLRPIFQARPVDFFLSFLDDSLTIGWDEPRLHPCLGPSDSLPLLATHPGTPGLVAKLAQAQKKKKKNLKSFSGASNFPKFSPETDARKRPLLLFSPNQQSTYICYLLMHLTLLTLLSVKINVVKVKEIHRMTGKVQKIFTFK